MYLALLYRYSLHLRQKCDIKDAIQYYSYIKWTLVGIGLSRPSIAKSLLEPMLAGKRSDSLEQSLGGLQRSIISCQAHTFT